MILLRISSFLLKFSWKHGTLHILTKTFEMNAILQRPLRSSGFLLMSSWNPYTWMQPCELPLSIQWFPVDVPWNLWSPMSSFVSWCKYFHTKSKPSVQIDYIFRMPLQTHKDRVGFIWNLLGVNGFLWHWMSHWGVLWQESKEWFKFYTLSAAYLGNH